jgi:broad specificity phosphatase PhoE
VRLDSLIVVRHGESTGNVARAAALRAGAEEGGITQRDPDVPLSELGRAQAAALGERLAALPADERPTVMLASPYVRARQTAEIALMALDSPPFLPDERLRDREAGAFDGLTWLGIQARFPEEHLRRTHLGKFYHRPPGGESWADVALRLRGVLTDLDREHPGERVLLVAHDVVTILVRYILERLTENEILEIEKTPIGNGSFTRWQVSEDRLVLDAYNDTAHLVSLSRVG